MPPSVKGLFPREPTGKSSKSAMSTSPREDSGHAEIQRDTAMRSPQRHKNEADSITKPVNTACPNPLISSRKDSAIRLCIIKQRIGCPSHRQSCEVAHPGSSACWAASSDLLDRSWNSWVYSVLYVPLDIHNSPIRSILDRHQDVVLPNVLEHDEPGLQLV